MGYFKRKRTNKRNKKRGTKKYRGGAPDIELLTQNFKMEILKKIETDEYKVYVIDKLNSMHEDMLKEIEIKSFPPTIQQ